MQIEIAAKQDLAFLKDHDRHISAEELEYALLRGRIYVLKQNGEIAAWLRWSLFWDNTPFMNMLYVLERYRRQGFGKQLVAFWEQQMREQGYRFVLTSSQSDEQAQHFYRHLGYRDAGVLLLPNEAGELFFIKDFT